VRQKASKNIFIFFNTLHLSGIALMLTSLYKAHE
ncbi:hypothetical protein LTSEMIN_3907, partial [Salmonella enterica subsp. enterica serovar Minnesota str. A4-603]